MPKEPFIISKFLGASPAMISEGAPIRFENGRVDVANNVAMPENEDSVYGDGASSVPINEKLLYVDGEQILLQHTSDGSIVVGGTTVGNVSADEKPAIDIIGRQAVIATGGAAKYLRYGYAQEDLLRPTDSDTIVFEDDIITSKYTNFGDVIAAIHINSDLILMVYRGARRLTMYVNSTTTYHNTVDIADDEIVAIGYDIGVVAGGPPYEAVIGNIYYAYYSDGNLTIKKFELSSCFDGSYVFLPNDFIADPAPLFTNYVVVDETHVPSGCKLDSIAVTKDKVFLGYNERTASGARPLGYRDGDAEVAAGEDLMFAILKSDFNTSPALSVTVANKKLVPSKLPFMPYEAHSLAIKTNTCESNGEDYADTTDSNIDVGEYYIPYGTTAFSKNNLAAAMECLYDSSMAETVATKTLFYMTMPGMCGAVAISITPVASLCVVDYTNNIAGYMVASTLGGLWIPKNFAAPIDGYNAVNTAGLPSAQAYPTYGENNGTGYINVYCHKLSTDSYDWKIKAESEEATVWTTRMSSNYIAKPSANNRIIVFYCWNGVAIADTFVLDWQYHNIDSTPLEIEVSKFFDDGTVTRTIGTPETHTRFVLYPNTTGLPNMPQTFATSSIGVPHNGTNAIDSVIALSDNSPTLLCSAALATNDDGYIVADIDYDTMSEGSCITSFTPKFDYMGRLWENNVRSDAVTVAGSGGVIAIDMDPITDLITDPTTPNFDVDTSMPILVAEGNGSGTGLIAGIHKYRLAFIYDGTSISPLSDLYEELTLASPEDGKLTLTVDLDTLYSISARITGISIYHAMVGSAGGEETDLYRLVKSIDLTTDNWTYASGLYTKVIVDVGTRYASFNADAGYSESVRSISVDRGCQCVCGNYLFAGNLRFPYDDTVTVNTDNLVARSLPFQPSVFNYSEEFAVLPFTPIALVPFNGRVYAFGSEQYCVLNPDSMAIETTSNLCGLASRHHIITTDYGIFAYYAGNVYHIDHSKATPIGADIYTNATGTYSMTLDLLISDIYMGYAQRRNAVIIVGKADESVIMFAYGIGTNKWSGYVLDILSESVPLSVYDKEDTSVVVINSNDGTREEDIAYKLFDGDELREMVVEWLLDCGDPNQNKYIYKIEAYQGTTLNCSTPTATEILLDNALMAQTATKGVFSLRITDNLPITNVRLLMRRLVVK